MKNTYTNEPSRSAALAGALNRPGIEILRYGLVIVLLWIGGMKFTSYETAGIAPLEMHSPLMNWLYVLMGQLVGVANQHIFERACLRSGIVPVDDSNDLADCRVVVAEVAE